MLLIAVTRCRMKTFLSFLHFSKENIFSYKVSLVAFFFSLSFPERINPSKEVVAIIFNRKLSA